MSQEKETPSSSIVRGKKGHKGEKKGGGKAGISKPIDLKNAGVGVNMHLGTGGLT